MSEVGELLGVPIDDVRAVCAHERFPQPIAMLSTGPVWRREDVADFAETQAFASPARPR